MLRGRASHQAEISYSKALASDAGYAERIRTAPYRLLQGRFRDGWQEYEWRWKQARTTVQALPQPAWDGSPIPGKTILLYSEQRAGDTIQFIRYARLLKRDGVSVVLHCQEALRPLLSGKSELTAVVSGSTLLPRFDVRAVDEPATLVPDLRIHYSGGGALSRASAWLCGS